MATQYVCHLVGGPAHGRRMTQTHLPPELSVPDRENPSGFHWGLCTYKNHLLFGNDAVYVFASPPTLPPPQA